MFNAKAQSLADQRAAKRQIRNGTSFLLARAAQDTASRLEDISRQFTRALLIGPFDSRALILENLPCAKHPRTFDYSPQLKAGDKPYDLIISLLHLQSDQALPQTLRLISTSLQPDGLFLGALFGGQSLTELRQTLYAADQELLGGAAARIIPMVDYSQCAGLLSHAGLALPVIDTDRFNVAYSGLMRLVSDLRDLGLSNCLETRTPNYLTRAYPARAQALYQSHFGRKDGKLLCQFEILWMSAWRPHESQQKPLKPGSATMRLGDALGAAEHKLKG